MSECSTSDSLGRTGTIVFATIYAVVLICTSIYSYRSLKKFDDEFRTYGCFKRLYLFAKDLFKRRKCYVPIITHLMDQITDISVIIQFGQLAATTSPSQCGGLNMNYLFILSIFTLLFYRIISAFIIFYGTRIISRLIFQFLDLELFRTLYINYLCDNIEPCSPQKWITSLEAIFESAPQALIQTIYLTKTGSFSKSPLVVLSLLFSLRSIIGKIVSDDKMISIDTAKGISFRKKKINTFSCISWLYVARYSWRILDVSCRIFGSAFLWLALGGFYLFLYIIVEALIFIIVSIKTKRYEYLFGMVSMTISKSNPSAELITQNLMWYRISMNFIVMGIVTFFTYVSIESKYIDTTYSERQTLLREDRTTFALFVYCWCGILIIPFLSYFLYLAAFKGVKSNARTLKDMIKSNDYDGIIEMQVYKNQYGIFDEITEQNLLMLCCQQNYGKLARHIFSLNDVDPKSRTKNNECILDFLGHSLQDTVEKRKQTPFYKSNKKHLFELFIGVGSRYPFMVSSTGCTAFQSAFYHGNTEIADRLLNNLITTDDTAVVISTFMTRGSSINFDKVKLLQTFGKAWYWAVEGDQPKSIEWLENHADEDERKVDWGIPETAIQNDKTFFLQDMIKQKKINILRAMLQDTKDRYIIRKEQLWFYAVECNDVEIMQSMKEFVDDVNVQNDDGNTVLHIQCIKVQNETTIGMIKYLQTICDKNIRNTQNKTAKEYLEKHNMYFEHCENQITVYVIQARNLPHPTAADPDPYINVTMNKEIYKSNIIRNTVNPIYNDVFVTSGKNLFSTIDRITFDLHYDINLAKDDFVGRHTMRIFPYKDSTTPVKWIQLKDNKGRHVAGEIQVKVKFRENAKSLNVRYYSHLMQLEINKATIVGVRRADPYVIVEWGAQGFQTNVIDNTLTPEWHSSAFVYLHKDFQSHFQLKLTVMDKDTFTKDDLLGVGYISANQIFKNCVDGQKFTVTLKLRRMDKIEANTERGLEDVMAADTDSKESTSEIGGDLEIEISLIAKTQIDNEFYQTLLDKFEKNNDGVLQKSEFEAMFQSAEQKMPEYLEVNSLLRAGTMFNKFDENKDEIIDENDIKNMMMDRDFQASEISAGLMALYVKGDVNIPLLSPLKRRKNITKSNEFQTVRYLKDRETGLLVKESVPSYIATSLRLMYDTKLGRAVMKSGVRNKIAMNRKRSRGMTMDSSKSAKEIATFIERHNVNTKILCQDVSEFKTFNDFFARRIRIDECRPMHEYKDNEKIIVSPADCRLMAWHSINDSTRIWIKGQKFTLDNLIMNDIDVNIDVNKYNGGAFVISRLAPQDYHRWHYPISGKVTQMEVIEGTLYEDNPIVINKEIDVYTENKRAVIEINGENSIGSWMLMFVIGAGKIGSFNFYKCEGCTLKIDDEVRKGDVAGEFRYGGSTILLLFEPGKVRWDTDILRHVDNKYETLIKVRERIGRIVA